VAFGTSLAVALPTVLTSAYGHTQKGNVCWHDAGFIGCFGMLTGFLGGTAAVHLPVQILTFLFGMMLILGAVRMAAVLPSGENQSLSVPACAGIGSVTGFLSGLLGVGGGTIIVPLLTIFGKYPMVLAAATSAASIVFITLGGIAAYLVNGVSAGVDLSAYGFYLAGYTDLFMGSVLILTAVPMAFLGVRFVSRVPEKQLRRVFIVLMLVIAADMLGVFNWFF
jgi:uncharacterized membrane protein YfcA